MIYPLITIIIPVYDIEKYIRKCLESVLQQTYTNLEIILVDDGSPDNCPQICDEYAAKDNRIRVIHKTNGGLSSARNAGLDIARGEWIGFVDSDDWLLPNMYERLYNAIEYEDADLAICGYKYVDESDKPVGERFSVIRDEVLSKSDVFDIFFRKYNTFYITVWNKLYAKKIFLNLRFPDGKIHEDEFTVHHIFNECDKIVTISDVLYMYVQRKESIMNEQFSLKRFDAVDALCDRYMFFRDKGLNAQAKLSLRSAYILVLSGLNRLNCEQAIKPYYNKIFWLLVMAMDLRAVIKLFIFRHKDVLPLIKHMKFFTYYASG